jgi:hypothetical protein
MRLRRITARDFVAVRAELWLSQTYWRKENSMLRGEGRCSVHARSKAIRGRSQIGVEGTDTSARIENARRSCEITDWAQLEVTEAPRERGRRTCRAD